MGWTRSTKFPVRQKMGWASPALAWLPSSAFRAIWHPVDGQGQKGEDEYGHQSKGISSHLAKSTFKVITYKILIYECENQSWETPSPSSVEDGEGQNWRCAWSAIIVSIAHLARSKVKSGGRVHERQRRDQHQKTWSRSHLRNGMINNHFQYHLFDWWLVSGEGNEQKYYSPHSMQP